MEHERAVELIEGQLELIEESKGYVEDRIEYINVELTKQKEDLYELEIEKRELKHTLQSLKGEMLNEYMG